MLGGCACARYYTGVCLFIRPLLSNLKCVLCVCVCVCVCVFTSVVCVRVCAPVVCGWGGAASELTRRVVVAGHVRERHVDAYDAPEADGAGSAEAERRAHPEFAHTDAHVEPRRHDRGLLHQYR